MRGFKYNTKEKPDAWMCCGANSRGGFKSGVPRAELLLKDNFEIVFPSVKVNLRNISVSARQSQTAAKY
jgi:hypothetical protein